MTGCFWPIAVPQIVQLLHPLPSFSVKSPPPTPAVSAQANGVEQGITNMDRLPSILPALALSLLPLAHADTRQPQPCDAALLDSLATQLGQHGWTPPDRRGGGPLVAAACKPWPDDPTLSVVSLAYRDAEDTTPADERNLNWLMAKVDTQSGQLRAELFAEGIPQFRLPRRRCRAGNRCKQSLAGYRALSPCTRRSRLRRGGAQCRAWGKLSGCRRQ